MSPPPAAIRVVEAATFITGPYAAILLGSLGAEVIKVESLEQGDPFRLSSKEGLSPRFVAHSLSKKILTANVRSEAGCRLVQQLAAQADVFIENFPPGVADRLGIGYQALRELNPQGNVYLDLRGWVPKYFPEQLVRQAGTILQDKCLLGSDWPVLTSERRLKEFADLPIENGARQKILLENAKRLLRVG